MLEVLAESVARQPWAWLAVVGLGAYHGLNPGMGWLLAVSNGMQARQARGVLLALPPIALGHLLAMAAALLPFVMLAIYLEKLQGIRVAAGAVLVAFGAWKLLSRRHPRFLARVRPAHLTLWSFLMATAHGAGLMLVPVVLDLCGGGADADAHHQAVGDLADGNLGIALNAATAHTLAMLMTGGAIAWVVYRYVGLRLLSRAWLNVDLIWALLLVAVGALSLAAALR
jgi:hypothetical protein